MGKKIWLSIQARKFGYDVTLRSFVRTLRVGVSRNESLSSPLESFVSKGFRNDWQIRICQLSKCLVEFRSRPFNFWGGYREFQKKIFCSTEFERKKACKEVSGKNNILHWKKYRSWRIMLKKKILHRYMSGKKFLPKLNHPYPLPTNVQWSCQPFRGCGKKQIWHLSKCHPSTKWLAHVHHVVVYKTKVLHFKIESTPVKDTNGKKKFKRMLSFLFVDKRKLFAMKLSFVEFNRVFYTADRSAWLVLNQPRQRGFWRHLRHILYSMIKEKYAFKKEFLYL